MTRTPVVLLVLLALSGGQVTAHGNALTDTLNGHVPSKMAASHPPQKEASVNNEGQRHKGNVQTPSPSTMIAMMSLDCSEKRASGGLVKFNVTYEGRYNKATDEDYFVLMCHVPTRVIEAGLTPRWLTPSGQEVNTTSREGNYFLLKLTDTAEDGQYTCCVSVRRRCYHSSARTSTVTLDSTTVLLHIVEASRLSIEPIRQRLSTETNRLKTNMDELERITNQTTNLLFSARRRYTHCVAGEEIFQPDLYPTVNHIRDHPIVRNFPPFPAEPMVAITLAGIDVSTRFNLRYNSSAAVASNYSQVRYVGRTWGDTILNYTHMSRLTCGYL